MLTVYPLLRETGLFHLAVRIALLSSAVCLGLTPRPSQAITPDGVEIDIPISVGGFGLQFFQDACPDHQCGPRCRCVLVVWTAEEVASGVARKIL